jgi:hypothetical protein
LAKSCFRKEEAGSSCTTVWDFTLLINKAAICKTRNHKIKSSSHYSDSATRIFLIPLNQIQPEREISRYGWH